jgi:hypothetical protein
MLPLEDVHERLLHAGITPRHARRYVMELRDHLADLVSRERAAGLDPYEAEAKARTLLGTEAQLVQAMIDGGAPRSFAARAPWAVFGVLPLATFIVTAVLLSRWSMHFFLPYSALPGADIPQSVRAIGMALSFIHSYAIGPALTAACVFIALRQRLSSVWLWVGLGLIALACGPFGINIQFLPLEGGLHGGIRGSLAQMVFDEGQVDSAATFAKMAARTTVLFALPALTYALLRRRDETAPR